MILIMAPTVKVVYIQVHKRKRFFVNLQSNISATIYVS